MDDSRLATLRQISAAFRKAIEAARAERAPGALPYFPDGACRMTSRLLAQHLAHRPDGDVFGRAQLVSGVLPSSISGVRHSWLQLDGTVVDLTADPFGELPVIVGAPTPFHRSLTEILAEDAATTLAALSADEKARLARQLTAIESRLSEIAPPL